MAKFTIQVEEKLTYMRFYEVEAETFEEADKLADAMERVTRMDMGNRPSDAKAEGVKITDHDESDLSSPYSSEYEILDVMEVKE